NLWLLAQLVPLVDKDKIYLLMEAAREERSVKSIDLILTGSRQTLPEFFRSIIKKFKPIVFNDKLISYFAILVETPYEKEIVSLLLSYFGDGNRNTIDKMLKYDTQAELIINLQIDPTCGSCHKELEEARLDFSRVEGPEA